MLEDTLAEEILNGNLNAGEKARALAEDDKIVIKNSEVRGRKSEVGRIILTIDF